MRDAVIAGFASRFGTEPALVVRSPGRVNLIGDHTDYSDGFVLPMTLSLGTWLAASPASGSRVRASSDRFDAAEFDLADLHSAGPAWTEYVKGMMWSMEATRGLDLYVAGNLPIGAGLSSSASLELAVGRAVAAVEDRPWDAKQAALLAQKAENEWVGVACGIMDQMVIAAGLPGSALLIDCRTLEIQPHALPPETAVVIMDTGTTRSLADSAYNERRRSCEEAAAALGKASLRDVTFDDLLAARHRMEPELFRRARHVVTENDRTVRAAHRMSSQDAPSVGELMVASHESLRDDYEVSSPALDAMVAAALGAPGVFGARMTGAGFGGAAVALLDEGMVEPFVDHTEAAYRRGIEAEPRFITSPAAGGVELLT